MSLSRLFDERPIRPKESLTERLLDKAFNFSDHILRRLLSRVAYYFSRGPFLRFRIILKRRWEDICALRVFPYKWHTTLQLFALGDDYIQEQIRKPPAQTTCSDVLRESQVK